MTAWAAAAGPAASDQAHYKTNERAHLYKFDPVLELSIRATPILIARAPTGFAPVSVSLLRKREFCPMRPEIFARQLRLLGEFRRSETDSMPKKSRVRAIFALFTTARREHRPAGWRGSADRAGLRMDFPANREFCREFSQNAPPQPAVAEDFSVESDTWRHIPYGRKQGKKLYLIREVLFKFGDCGEMKVQATAVKANRTLTLLRRMGHW